ncbi:Protein F59C6.8 [Aphelenchoides avenae]|nr:Protein F59C6.8 [Aphelenchus avenae]
MGVVACFSRLFFGERWQVMVALLEVYRQYGVDLQVYYVQSALTEILDYLKTYERDGLVHIEHWNPMIVNTFEHAFDSDPNMEIEWQNQPGACTDCLVRFKEGKKF